VFVPLLCQILAACTPTTKLLFICSPGNPTSKVIPLSDIERIATSREQYGGLIVVDEAYIDFCDDPASSALSLVHKFPNVVVLQTLSKAFGLAGIRCGFAVGAPDVIQLMNNVKAPYNVNEITSRLATQVFSSSTKLQEHIQKVLQQRTMVMDALSKMDFVTTVYPSDANFVLFRLKGAANDGNNGTFSVAQAVYKAMADGGIVSRYRGTELHCAECIRVTIGTPEQNEAFLEALPKHYASIASSRES
jgi:histidinol-phosphate aminotransferase